LSEKFKKRSVDVFGLTKDLSEISKRAIGETYSRVGSIRNCKTPRDFGRYRRVLVLCYEEQLIRMKNKMEKINKLVNEAKKITSEADEVRSNIKELFNLG